MPYKIVRNVKKERVKFFVNGLAQMRSCESTYLFEGEMKET